MEPYRLVPITERQRVQLEALERELRLRGNVIWADQLAEIVREYDAEAVEPDPGPIGVRAVGWRGEA